MGEGKLGLPGGPEEGDGGITYRCAGETAIHVYPSPENAGKSGATLAAWGTDDVDGTVDELSSKGVQFEQYDMDPIKTNEKGIADVGGELIAWFKDPDGNTLAVGLL
jgi:Glyoxalase/Bleomycin resistance protein/Dioxygenase superfamily